MLSEVDFLSMSGIISLILFKNFCLGKEYLLH